MYSTNIRYGMFVRYTEKNLFFVSFRIGQKKSIFDRKTTRDSTGGSVGDDDAFYHAARASTLEPQTKPNPSEKHQYQEMRNVTLQGIHISHLGKRKIIFKMAFLGDMLVSWRVHPRELRNIRMSPRKGPFQKDMFIFQPLIFREYVSFSEE